MAHTDNTDYDKILQFAADFAYEAGAIMLDYFYVTDKQVETKSNNTPVTVADNQINYLLVERINETYPGHGVLGEEASIRTSANELWVCDPIDGTRSFIMGVPMSMFSLAFVVDGIPVVAVVYDPYLQRLYTAIKGRGALCNGTTISVNGLHIEQATIVGSGSMPEVEKRFSFFQKINAVGGKVCFMGGGVYKACLIAEGKVEGHAFPGKGAHDIAAVKLIVEEAGGKVTDLDGNEQRYDRSIRGAIISNGVVHDDVLKAVQQFGVEDFLGF